MHWKKSKNNRTWHCSGGSRLGHWRDEQDKAPHQLRTAMHHHTVSLSLSSFSLSVFFLCLSVCLSLCLSPCGVVVVLLWCGVVCHVVLCCVLWCGVVLWCVVCPSKTSPCVPAPRAYVETHVRPILSRALAINPGCYLPFCQSLPGPHISVGSFFFQ